MRHTRSQLTHRARAIAGLFLVICISYLPLAGCGFHLRGAGPAALPPELSVMRITMGGAAYPLALIELRNALKEQGGIEITEDVAAPVPVLRLSGETTAQRVLAIDSSGRVSDYLLDYRISFSLTDAAGQRLIENQTVKLQREYRFDRLNVLATERENELLRSEMRRDAAQQIIRRLTHLNRNGGP